MCSSCDPSSVLTPTNSLPNELSPVAAFLFHSTVHLPFHYQSLSVFPCGHFLLNAVDCYLSSELCGLCFFWCSPTSHCTALQQLLFFHSSPTSLPLVFLLSSFAFPCGHFLCVLFSLSTSASSGKGHWRRQTTVYDKTLNVFELLQQTLELLALTSLLLLRDLPCSPPDVNSRPPTGQLCSWLSHALGKQLLTTDR